MRLQLLVPLLAAAAGLLAVPVLLRHQLPPSAASARAAELPDPSLDPGRQPGAERTAILAGGCFWGLEAIFEEIRGVSRVETGYAGGSADTADYRQVSSGRTGHAEGIRITFDPAEVSYGELLKVFFGVAHDPTQLNRQGPDIGEQYRSAIFTTDPQLQRMASSYIRQLDASGRFDEPIVTRIEASDSFFPAEPYHQDFVRRNPRHPYVVIHDLPKLEQFRSSFPELLR
jgi:peptide-methionine (S)-S-oxide reductase